MEDRKKGKDAAEPVAVTYYVAECMEFVTYGEYHEDIKTAEEAVKLYKAIPSERLYARKGIGIHIHESEDPEDAWSYELVTGRMMDIDVLQLMYKFEEYPQIMEAARKLLSLLPDLEVRDPKNLLAEKKPIRREADVLEMAEKVNQLQKAIDPEGYESFYPDEDRHKKKITMQLLTEKGKAEYEQWLEAAGFPKNPELSAQAQQLLQTLKESEMKAPETMEPFVSIDFSEELGLEAGDVLMISEAVPLFGKLDYEQCAAKKRGESIGYNKTGFHIFYLNEGNLCTYDGRQDFGDGDGDLFGHMEAHQDFYLNSKEGRAYLGSLPEAKAAEIRDACLYVREELLPTLQYFCNLRAIETALLEEQQLNKTIPLESEQHKARSQYQKDVLAFVEESRRILNYGGRLPKMPDIRDYEKDCKKTGYNEQVMREIKKEAQERGLEAEEYIKAITENSNKTR